MAVFSALAARAGRHRLRAICRLPLGPRQLLLAFAALLAVPLAMVGRAAHAVESLEALSVRKCSYTPAAARSDCHNTQTNFVVRSYVGGPHARDVARHCEQICSHLKSTVFHLKSGARWNPKCLVVLHASKSSYLAAVGRNGAQTIGSSTISLSGGRVTQRRIDLLAINVDQGLAALPHELVHVLFVDVFPTRVPPKWAEEGLALVMDSAEKQSRHRRDLDDAVRAHSTLPVSRLLADENYPSLAQRAAFYGQSLSLVEYLMQQAPPADFVRFVKLSVERGADRALVEVYHSSAVELERDWRIFVTSTPLTAAR